MKKISICLLCMLMLFGYVTVPVAAANDGIMPCYNNVIQTNTSFDISESGVATVTVSYNGITGVTTGATITTKIQKRTLGMIWTKVDIGEPNIEIVITSTKVIGDYHYDIQLNSTGNYRAVITYTVSGSGGADDVIEDICTAEYNQHLLKNCPSKKPNK